MSRAKNKIILYIGLILLGFIMTYPLLFMLSGSFKDTHEILTSTSLIPKKLDLTGFIEGWKGTGQHSFLLYFINSIKLVVPTVFFTVASSVIVAYGFARFNFPFKKILFMVLISTLMLPNAVLIIPRYLLFDKLDWLDSYLPFIVPAMFGTYPFFIFMMVQFFRGIPKELDEAAKIDGCNSFGILTKIMLPICKPALFSAAIFQFVWTWNDFFNSLIYINSIKKYTLPLGLRMTMDIATQTNWNQIMAMSLLTIIPPVIIFFFAQRYFVEGISNTGLKG